MSELIDTLKFRSYGVKKPLESKEKKIAEMLDQNKRYYPNDARGNIDEWGAVLKRQTDLHNQQQTELQMRNKQAIEHYGMQLEKQLQNKDDVRLINEAQRMSEREQIMNG